MREVMKITRAKDGSKREIKQNLFSAILCEFSAPQRLVSFFGATALDTKRCSTQEKNQTLRR
jgi:hypothetical protein